MNKAIVVDLDGTLADIGDRDPYNQQDQLMKDVINEPLKKVINLFISEGYELIVITGRWERYRHLTIQWLYKNGLKINDKLLFMRPVSNYDTGTRLKEWYLENILQNQYDIALAFEDIYSTAKMYRQHGIPCWQVNSESWDKTV